MISMVRNGRMIIVDEGSPLEEKLRGEGYEEVGGAVPPYMDISNADQVVAGARANALKHGTDAASARATADQAVARAEALEARAERSKATARAAAARRDELVAAFEADGGLGK